jgi:phosphatidylglycerol:prolipoprotein diacylglycerol transferase
VLDTPIAAISYPPIPIWDVGPLQFSLHGLFAAVGFIAGGWLATRELDRRGYDTLAYQSVLSWAIVGALLGARYLTSPAQLLDGASLGEALNPFAGNFSIMGGFAGGILAGWWRMRRVDLPRTAVFDASAFGLALGTIVGRIGDLAIVEHLGSATSVAWGYGIRPGYDVAPQHDALECAVSEALPGGLCPVPGTSDPGIYHHVAAYDLLGAVIVLGVLYVLSRRVRLRYGQLFSFWVIWYGLQRFVLDFLRFGNGDATLGPFTWNQVSGLAASLLGVFLFVRFRRNPIVSAEHDHALNVERLTAASARTNQSD